MAYHIRLKDGHRYDFNNYRNICIEEKNGVKIIIIEIQFEKGKKYRKVELIPRTILYSNIEHLTKKFLEL